MKRFLIPIVALLALVIFALTRAAPPPPIYPGTVPYQQLDTRNFELADYPVLRVMPFMARGAPPYLAVDTWSFAVDTNWWRLYGFNPLDNTWHGVNTNLNSAWLWNTYLMYSTITNLITYNLSIVQGGVTNTVGSMNPTDGYVPFRLNSTNFADSYFYRIVNGMGIDTNIYFGPGTTNILYRYSQSLRYQAAESPSVIVERGSGGVTASVGVGVGGTSGAFLTSAAEVQWGNSTDTLHMNGGTIDGNGTMGSPLNIGDNNNPLGYIIGETNRLYSFFDATDTNYVRLENEMAGTIAVFDIQTKTNNVPGPITGYSFRTNGVEILSISGPGGGGGGLLSQLLWTNSPTGGGSLTASSNVVASLPTGLYGSVFNNSEDIFAAGENAGQGQAVLQSTNLYNIGLLSGYGMTGNEAWMVMNIGDAAGRSATIYNSQDVYNFGIAPGELAQITNGSWVVMNIGDNAGYAMVTDKSQDIFNYGWLSGDSMGVSNSIAIFNYGDWAGKNPISTIQNSQDIFNYGNAAGGDQIPQNSTNLFNYGLYAGGAQFVQTVNSYYNYGTDSGYMGVGLASNSEELYNYGAWAGASLAALVADGTFVNFTNVYNYGPEAGMQLKGTNATYVLNYGYRAGEQSTMTGVSDLYNYGSDSGFQSTYDTSASDIYNYGTSAGKGASYTNSFFILNSGNSAGQSMVAQDSSSILNLGSYAGANMVSSNSTDLVNIGSYAGNLSALTNSTHVYTWGYQAGRLLAGDGYTNIYLLGDNAQPTRKTNEFVFGSANDLYTFPGLQANFGGSVNVPGTASIQNATLTNYFILPRLSTTDKLALTQPTGSPHGGGSGLVGTDSVINGDLTSIAADTPSERIRQTGWITDFKARSNTGAGENIKFKVFRKSGATWSMIYEVPELIVTGTHTYTLSTPLFALEGDYVGIWTSNNTAMINVSTVVATPSLRYAAGDITTSSTFATTINNLSLDLECLVRSPQIVFAGDSIIEGANCGAQWYPFLDTGNAGPVGTITSSIAYQMAATNGWSYLNCAISSSTWATIVASQLSAMTAVNSKAWVIHAGVNDINTARTWADVLADMNTVKAALPAGTLLFIDEILPWTAGSDAQALTVRTWNSNYASWCAANGAYLISCHDAMGQLRVSTGQLDDLLTAYDQDGVHLKQPGVNEMSLLIGNALKTYSLGLNEGITVYDTTLNKAQVWDGSAWGAIPINWSDYLSGGSTITGSVGIGTNAPSEKLEVLGNIKATGSIKAGSVSAATSTLQSVGSFSESIATGSAATLGSTNDIYLCNVDAQLVTLPTAVGCRGRNYTVKLIAPATTGTVTNSPGILIDGATSYSLTASNKFVHVVSDNANWWIIGNN